MVQTPVKPMTLDAFLALPETEPPSEFVNGQIIQKPMPQGKHSRLQDKLVNVINGIVEPSKTACAFPELRCICGSNAVVPDIAVFTWDHLPIDDNGEIANVFSIAPDWMIEILSPGQGYPKVTRKIQCCLQHGAEMGWLIAPEDRAILVHKPERPAQIFLLEEDSDAVLPMPEFMNALAYTLEDVFGLLRI